MGFAAGPELVATTTGCTVTVNVWLTGLLLVPPLSTVTVTVAVPVAPLTGAKVNVPVLLELV